MDATPLRAPAALHALTNIFGDPDAAVQCATRWRTWGDLASAPIAEIARVSAGRAARIPQSCPPLDALPLGFTAVGRFDTAYPTAAADSPAAPAVLFLAGAVPDVPRVIVAGGRYASTAGIEFARRAARQAVDVGAAVVAVAGSDVGSAAIRATLDAGGRVVAVVPYGVCSAAAVAARMIGDIVAGGGAVISAADPTASRTATTQLVADRLAVALGRALVVAEAGLYDEGGLPMAAWALQMGRYLIVGRRVDARQVGLTALGSVALSRTDALTVLGDDDSLSARSAAGRTAADAVVDNDTDLRAAVAYGSGASDVPPSTPDQDGWQRI